MNDRRERPADLTRDAREGTLVVTAVLGMVGLQMARAPHQIFCRQMNPGAAAAAESKQKQGPCLDFSRGHTIYHRLRLHCTTQTCRKQLRPSGHTRAVSAHPPNAQLTAGNNDEDDDDIRNKLIDTDHNRGAGKIESRIQDTVLCRANQSSRHCQLSNCHCRLLLCFCLRLAFWCLAFPFHGESDGRHP
jgi:hypothetical protein